jgi:hypothetical protein
MGRVIATRVRPGLDVELAMRALLRQAFEGTGVRVDVSFPGTDRLPSVAATRVGGFALWPPGGIERPRVQIDCYAKERMRATNLCLDVLAYLKGVEGEVHTFGDGARFVLNAVSEDSGPVPNQDDDTNQGVYRVTATVSLTTHQHSPLSTITPLPGVVEPGEPTEE